MWKLFLSFVFTLLLSACAHDPAQTDSLKSSSANPAGLWQAVWVKGFDPDWPPAAEGPFDWSQNQLTTDPKDPGNWGKFYGGCNKLWRYWETDTSKDGETKRWGIVPGPDVCAEWVEGRAKEIFARSILLERAVTKHVAGAPDRRLDYRLDENGSLVWLDAEGNPVARFKPLPDYYSCENLRTRAHPMPINCHDPINAGHAAKP